MLTRPDGLTDADVAGAVRAGWGLSAGEIEHEPVGYGSHHWRLLDDDRHTWFVTVDDLTCRLASPGDTVEAAYGRLRAALATARALRDAGTAFVVAPAPGVGGDLVRRIDARYAVAVHPYVAGRRLEFDARLTAAERAAVLDLVVELHGAGPDVRRHARCHDFELPGRADLLAALADVGSRWDTGPHGEPTRALLAGSGGDVERALARHDRLAAEARARPERSVLTHGEPHPGNLVGTAAGWVLVDWDTTLLAPPERDLWLLDPGDGSVARRYAELTGRPVSGAMLGFFRLAWDLADLASFVARFRAPHGDTPDDRIARGALDHYLGHVVHRDARGR